MSWSVSWGTSWGITWGDAPVAPPVVTGTARGLFSGALFAGGLFAGALFGVAEQQVVTPEESIKVQVVSSSTGGTAINYPLLMNQNWDKKIDNKKYALLLKEDEELIIIISNLLANRII